MDHLDLTPDLRASLIDALLRMRRSIMSAPASDDKRFHRGRLEGAKEIMQIVVGEAATKGVSIESAARSMDERMTVGRSD